MASHPLDPPASSLPAFSFSSLFLPPTSLYFPPPHLFLFSALFSFLLHLFFVRPTYCSFFFIPFFFLHIWNLYIPPSKLFLCHIFVIFIVLCFIEWDKWVIFNVLSLTLCIQSLLPTMRRNPVVAVAPPARATETNVPGTPLLYLHSAEVLSSYLLCTLQRYFLHYIHLTSTLQRHHNHCSFYRYHATKV